MKKNRWQTTGDFVPQSIGKCLYYWKLGEVDKFGEVLLMLERQQYEPDEEDV